MTELAKHLSVGLFAGMGLGFFYFFGLWWTLERVIRSHRKLFWLAGSFLARAAVLIGGFFWIAEGHWERLAACFLGFLMIRGLMTGRWKAGKNTTPAA